MSDSRAKGSGLDWFVRRGGAVRGPFSSAKVRHYVLEGRLQLDDEVSTDRANWQRIGSVDEVVPRQMRNDDTAVAEAEQAQRRIDRWRALRAIVVVAVVVTALVIAVTLIGQPEGDWGPDCTAPPQPGVVW